MSDDNTEFNVKGLDQLLRALKSTNLPVARIGILGDKNARTQTKGEKKIPTNAEVGAVHEFGSPSNNIPQRSFLRIPIADNLNREIENSGLLNKDSVKQVIKEGSILSWLKKVTVIAEGIVVGAFDTGGYGKWPAWRTKGYTNNTGDLLVDTTQLRNSITNEVK